MFHARDDRTAQFEPGAPAHRHDRDPRCLRQIRAFLQDRGVA